MGSEKTVIASPDFSRDVAISLIIVPHQRTKVTLAH